jgi:hypothetical protein
MTTIVVTTSFSGVARRFPSLVIPLLLPPPYTPTSTTLRMIMIILLVP